MKKVLCIAEACCDMIFAGLPQIPALGQEIYCREFTVKPGGGTNTAISLARLEVPTTMVTRLGGDDMGLTVRRGLEAAGVTLRGDIGDPAVTTDVSAVLSTSEDRCFASYGAGGYRFPQDILEEEIQKADIVHTFLGYCYSYPIAALCHQYGKRLSLDTSWVDTENPALALSVLPHCDYLKLNQVEAQRLTGAEDPESALRYLASLVREAVVITLGGQGSIGLCRGSGEILRCEAETLGAFRDSCGAGDNFAAGMLCGLAREEPLSTCMAFGTRVAGLSVTWLGGNDETLNCTKLYGAFQT